jgi:hypothetical protein
VNITFNQILDQSLTRIGFGNDAEILGFLGDLPFIGSKLRLAKHGKEGRGADSVGI